MAINNYLSNSINFPASFLYAANAPLDSRLVVLQKKDLKPDSFVNDKGDSFWYTGMIVSCVEDGKAYILKSASDGFVEIGGGTTSTEPVLTFKGTVANLAALPTNPSSGDVYNITTSFTYVKPDGTTSGPYPAGTNVVAYQATDSQGNNKMYWDALGGTFDTSAFDWEDI